MMRRESPADDLLHAVHHLARLAGEEEADPDVHLDIGDLAALTAGTLFESECTRVENHLLVCRACRDAAAALHREYEAGAVPILMRRRAPTGPSRPTIREKITRRWSPTIIALLVFAVVLMVTAGRNLLLGEKDVAMPQRRLVVSRVGGPDVRMADNSLRPATPGEWLESGETLVLETGDVVVVAGEDGTLAELTMDAEHPLAVSPLLEEIFAGASRRWITRRGELGRKPAVQGPPPLTVLHPIGKTLDRRPAVQWVAADEEESFAVEIRPSTGRAPVYEESAAGGLCRFPSKVVALQEGRDYVAHVAGPGGEAEARFTIVRGGERERIEGELDELDHLVGREANVLRAELLWERGLRGEARRELERLRKRDASNLNVLARLKLLLADLGLEHEESRILKLLLKRGMPR